MGSVVENRNHAILVVSFGTTHIETCTKTLDAIESDIQRHYPSYSLYKAWTNTFIRNKFEKKYGVHIFSIAEAIERMHKDGITHVFVQPTYVLEGLEFESMKKELDLYRHLFTEIKIGPPLLSSAQDIQSVSDILSSSWDLSAHEAIVYMGHGTEHHSNTVYSLLNKKLSDKGNHNIIVGTMCAPPTLTDVIKMLKEQNIQRIFLAPLMIVAGSHAINNLAGDRPDSWKNILEAENYEVHCLLKGLGEYEEIRHIFSNHIANNI